MFELNCRFQIAACMVLGIIVIDYLRTPHLKLLSARFFQLMLCATAANLILDLTTVYTITHIDQVGADWNRFFHQLFIGSVILMLFFYYMYIRLLSSDQKRIRRQQWILLLFPLVVSMGFILFGDLKYRITEKAAYSHGPMALAVYMCALIYLILGLRLSFQRNSVLTHTQRISIRLGMAVWSGFLLTQVLYPRLLLSGIGFVLLILIVYFSYENPKENYDVELKCFNQNAFGRMLSEYYEQGRELYLVSLSCENLERINRVLGYNKGIEALNFLNQMLGEYTNEDVFHSRSKILSVFVHENGKELQQKLEELQNRLSINMDNNVKLLCNISVIDSRKYTKEKDDVYELIHFISKKKFGRECTLYSLTEELVKEMQRTDALEELLSQALENDGFEMYYQPIYCTVHKCFESAEALVRLKNTGELGFVSPEEFIPIAEEKGLIMEIGDKTLEMVAGFMKKERLADLDIHYIEVNLSAIQAAAPKLTGRFMRIMDRCGLAPSSINLEITETATVNFGESFVENIGRLREAGFSFSMDDFGTGYSNLSQMNQINYDLVKLDKSLIWPAFGENKEEARKAEQLLDSVISLLKSIHLKIVAEGVETKEMVDYLTERGVEYIQGYYFSKPLPQDCFLEFLKKNKNFL